jgi:hypothetical protein
MSAPVGYPGSCVSMHCARICCDGCRYRPVLAAWHARQGNAAGYEARQDEARILTAKWDAERKAQQEAEQG